MVLAEFVKLKHGLYKSCGIEWFEGIVLEPCLLQPCLHVAGHCVPRPARKGGGARRCEPFTALGLFDYMPATCKPGWSKHGFSRIPSKRMQIANWAR